MSLIITKTSQGKLILFRSLLLLFFLVLMPSLQAQEKPEDDSLISLKVNDEPLSSVLSYIEKVTKFRFAYDADLIMQQRNITLHAEKKTIGALLNKLFDGTDITYTISGNQIILQKIISERITINGYTRDRRSGEFLIGTSIFLPASKRGVATNRYGFYSLTVPRTDSMEMEISYTGYKTIVLNIDGRKDINLNFSLILDQDTVTNRTVIVLNDSREQNVKRNQVDLFEFSSKIIDMAPAVSGNGDVIGSVQLSAGVQAGLDGTTGYFVRGGNSDQNQVILDEATLYNPNHLFGLVSVFNSDAIKKANLFKGGFPAAYGDYLSSVLDINMKDGNNQQYGGDLQLGTIATSVTLHGPMVSEKGSFLLSARRSTIDQVVRPFSSTDYFNNYYFYDVNAKFNYEVSSKDRVYLSYYRGSDHASYMTVNDDEDPITYKIAFGNQAFNFRWNHVYSKKIFSNTSLIYSNYYQRLSAIQEDYYAQLYSGIRDINFKTDLYFYPSVKHKLRSGLNILQQSVFPATITDKITTTGFVNINQNDIPEKKSYRVAAYLSDNIKVNKKFNIYAGVRIPMYIKPDVEYLSIEPRVSLLHLICRSTSVKLAYSRMHQYIHLVQSYNASFPAEIWIGSSRKVKPQASHQVSLGLYNNFSRNKFQTSLEFYYKIMENQMLFKGLSASTLQTDIEDELIFGKEWSYGSEFTIKKTGGKLNGWLSYSYSEAFQQFDSLNNRLKFQSANNRKHCFYLSAAYNINKHWTFSANFFFASARSVTLNTTSPSSTGSSGNQDDNPLFEDEDNNGGSVSVEPNNFRLTPYNRLDLGIRYKKVKIGKNRTWESEWELAVYNVYARQNTSFAYRSIDPVTKQATINQVSFIPVIPSLTYRLAF